MIEGYYTRIRQGMYGRLSVFMSLLVFAYAVPAILPKYSDVPVLVIDNGSAVEEGTFSNPVRLPVPDRRSKIMDRNLSVNCNQTKIPMMTYEECLIEAKRVWQTGGIELECLPPSSHYDQPPCVTFDCWHNQTEMMMKSDFNRPFRPSRTEIWNTERVHFEFQAFLRQSLLILCHTVGKQPAMAITITNRRWYQGFEKRQPESIWTKPEEIDTIFMGSYSYTSPDGVVITVNRVTDENGFRATADHLPTPPSMPEVDYGRLIVFLSLLGFACAAPIHLRELERVPVFVVDEVAVEEVLYNRDYLPTPAPKPEHRPKNSGSQNRDIAVLRNGTNKERPDGETSLLIRCGDFFFGAMISVIGAVISMLVSIPDYNARPSEQPPVKFPV
ncbi:hypothetical protein GHT06_009396 [Daphnia sinensis]|uniref:Uncharacterized protein n=1 Tax=Daphnia sinensis TaxID=1820382 RepID=A0AAD5Q332_9CRUS|nr:hypothetical protein GHT06_009396 [Daphnia sinensis]